MKTKQTNYYIPPQTTEIYISHRACICASTFVGVETETEDFTIDFVEF